MIALADTRITNMGSPAFTTLTYYFTTDVPSPLYLTSESIKLVIPQLIRKRGRMLTWDFSLTCICMLGKQCMLTCICLYVDMQFLYVDMYFLFDVHVEISSVCWHAFACMLTCIFDATCKKSSAPSGCPRPQLTRENPEFKVQISVGGGADTAPARDVYHNY